MSNQDELLTLLEGISRLKDEHDKLNNDLSNVRREVAKVEKAIKAILNEGGRPDAGASDFEVTVVAKSKDETERKKSVLEIIRELETEEGPAHVDTIAERASELGIDKHTVEAEIERLDSEAWIYEPARRAGVYRTTMR